MVQIGDTLGRYILESRLGKGGMGQVYRAQDPELRRAVAIKLLLPAGGDAQKEWAARMIREARAAAAFSHPNAVAVYDVGEHEGQPFIVMELVAGSTLRSHIGDDEVPIATRIRWLGDVARALGAAHKAGLVHRDIKPDNVMVGPDGHIKVLDFGIARQAGERDPTSPLDLETLTQTGAIVGTPMYMAPEQLRGGPIDGRADQFSWGVLGYELLAGSRPWPASDLLSLVAALTDDTPPLLRSLRADIPPAAEAAIARAISKRAEDRFATMADAAAALEALEAPKPVDEAPPPAAPNRASKRGARAAGALVAMAVIGGAGWTVLRSSAADRTAPSSVPIASSAPANTSSTPGGREPIPRHPCASPPADGSCAAPFVAWCDIAEKPIACCGKGLAAVGEDGLCGCSPGGSIDGPDAPPTCRRAPAGPSNEAMQEIVRRSFGDFQKCYEAALGKGKTSGRVAVAFEMTPEGKVFKARVSDASLPDVEAQACLLRTFRKLTFPPPTDGHRSVVYPLQFSPD